MFVLPALLSLLASASSQSLDTIQKDHHTDKYSPDKPPSTPPLKADPSCFVQSSSEDECLVPSSAATLDSFGPHLVIVRRGATPFLLPAMKDAMDPSTMALKYHRTGFSNHHALDVTSKHVAPSTHQIQFTCADPIGKYTLTQEDTVVQTILVLFNPFAAECIEHANEEISTDEYIFQTTGLIWQGLSDNYEAHLWEYDQFSGLNLLVAFHLLRHLTAVELASPVAVSRALSLQINEDMCIGKWGESDEYEFDNDQGWKHNDEYQCSTTEEDPDGTASSWISKCTDPTTWVGTSRISEQYWARQQMIRLYHASKGNKGLQKDIHRQLGNSKTNKPGTSNVQFCQCFVYAGILTTMGRSLGIATRPGTTTIRPLLWYRNDIRTTVNNDTYILPTAATAITATTVPIFYNYHYSHYERLLLYQSPRFVPPTTRTTTRRSRCFIGWTKRTTTVGKTCRRMIYAQTGS